MSISEHALPVLLRHYDRAVVEFVVNQGIKLAPLVTDKFSDLSPALQEFMQSDDEAAKAAVKYTEMVAAGIFVPRDRRLYIKRPNVLVLTHEFAHALDCALALHLGSHTDKTPYHSMLSSVVKMAWDEANASKSFVSAYAAECIQEFWAESVRAFVSGNVPRHPWGQVSPELLWKRNPTMAAHLTAAFDIIRNKVVVTNVNGILEIKG